MSCSKSRPLRFGRFIILLVLTGIFSGCALQNPDNRPLTERFQQDWTPRGAKARFITSPYILLGGAAALMIDGLIVHPVLVLDDAGRDTWNYCWRGFGQPDRFVTDGGSIPVRALAIPFVYVFDWSTRSIFDIPPNNGIQSP